jgi:putative N6-adenine-specific DNA methylase
VARGRFPHKGALENKVELAIRDALRGPRLPGPRPPHEPVPVLVHAEGDLVRVSVDASGDLLHRRGWRQETAKAPLRENLAAAVLRLAGWAPGEPLVDPMCGSGTFPIEAATIAMGRAPGAGRTFAFERWPGLDQAAVRKVRAAAGALQVLDRAALIAGSDRDPGAVRAAVGNARRAGVADRVRLDERRFEELVPPPVPGLIVSNTPYGERVGSGQIGWIAQALRARWAGWRVALLVPPSAKRVLTPLGLEEVAGFRNGGIPVRVLVGAIRQDR